MKKIKKAMACLIAATTMAVSITSMSAEAYAPTVSQTFSVGPYTATATIYKDSTCASASTSLANATNLTVSLTVTGTVTSTTTSDPSNSSYQSISKYGTISSARSAHTAIKGGYAGSKNLTYN